MTLPTGDACFETQMSHFIVYIFFCRVFLHSRDNTGYTIFIHFAAGDILYLTRYFFPGSFSLSSCIFGQVPYDGLKKCTSNFFKINSVPRPINFPSKWHFNGWERRIVYRLTLQLSSMRTAGGVNIDVDSTTSEKSSFWYLIHTHTAVWQN